VSFQISFNHPSFVAKELVYIAEAIQNEHISGDGKFTKLCNQFFETELGVKKSIMTTSCTDALELVALLLDLQPGDEFIVPSFTFVTTASAFALRGAIPQFVDIRKDTLNIDEMRIEEKITTKTKAIVVVHYAGVAAEMESILKIAKKYNLPVIEDNAHGLFAKYKGRYLGTFGDFSTQSFHETKNFTCGEGGALLINNEKFIERADILKDKGTNRKKFLQGLVDKYTWVDLGSSYVMSDILAAFLYAQLEQYKVVQAKRKSAWNLYFQSILPLAQKLQVQLPYSPSECEPAYHMFYLLCQSKEHRSALMQHLKNHGIQSVFHYLPLNASPMGQKFGAKWGDCPVSEDISDRILRLPFYTELSSESIHQVAEALEKFEF